MSTVDTGPAVETRQVVLDEIRAGDKFVLVTHENPDGDALGSLVGMQRLLVTLGKDSVMFMAADEFPLPYEYRFFDFEGLQSHPPDDLDERTIIFLDCGNIDRNPVGAFKGEDAHILNIDHHHDNTRFGTVNHVVEDASCTAEIVWDLLNELRVEPTLEIAEALYVGLVTDTGRFMYENTGPRAHVMAAHLIDAGIDVHEIYRRLYEGMPYSKLELLGRALAHVRRFDDGRLTVTRLTRDDFRLAGAEESYSEGIIDQLRSVEGTKVAALARESSTARAGARRSRCAPPTGRSTSRSSRERAAAAGTARPPASRPSCPTRSSSPSCASRSPPSCSVPWTASSSSTSPPARPRTTSRSPSRRGLGVRKAGHAGTLDPFATGLLLVLVGRARRAQRFLMALPKCYETVARSARRRPPATPRARSRRPARCRPRTSSCPPADCASARRPTARSGGRGRRAYERARAGEDVDVPEREVTVHRFEQLWREGDRAAFSSSARSGRTCAR